MNKEAIQYELSKVAIEAETAMNKGATHIPSFKLALAERKEAVLIKPSYYNSICFVCAKDSETPQKCTTKTDLL